ncbi:Biofilm associated protein A [Enterobacter cloacae]|uniref:Biofilm associated protein A n=1 Tax=Enterobacter cloacae complex TaxID=354276 RepID=UPI002108E98B|nr:MULTISPECIES: Biofilm associated protein A [Enterobacter cloacae complex]MCQ4447255.1 Biofilm associated protein A [Enterobacter cloacae]MDW2867718.1 Biofilm associated protein A [Enterobacter hormaechei]
MNKHECPAMVEITVDDILIKNEECLFSDDHYAQLLIRGNEGEKINLADLLPADVELGEWSKARGSVTVAGVQYEVYQHSGIETEVLVQMGMHTGLNDI